MKDDIFNAGEKDKSAADLLDKQAQFDQQRRINFGITFSTREGFEVLKDIMAFCHVNEPSYVRGDQRESDVREGERNVGLYIQAQLSAELRKNLIGG